MKKPIIIQFESDPFYVATANLILFQKDLEVARSASNIRQTKNLLQSIKDGKLTPDIAIVDTQIQNNHYEGEKVAKRIKEASPNTKIIAYTIMDKAEWADYVAVKSSLDPERTLIKGLSSLLGVELYKENK